MIAAMPRPRWPHLLRETSRHGTISWVVRVGHGPRIHIRSPYGTPDFEAEYHAAIRGDEEARPVKAGADTLAALWGRYRESSAWTGLARATQRQRENIMRGVLAGAGNMPLSEMTKARVIRGREDRARTPSQANNFLNTLRALFDWAVENESETVKKNPCDEVKNVKRPEGGFHPWTEGEIARFEAHWPIGTRERLAFAILLYTGLRRGDAARLGRQHVTDGMILMRAEKTGTQLTIPILPELQRVIDATKTGDLTFVAKANGQGMVKEGFGNWFHDACVAAGLPQCSAHGLRKAGAAHAAGNGATVPQLNAIFGWTGHSMASLYTESADRVRLAKEAMGKLSRNETGSSIPNPIQKVGSGG